MCGPQGASTPVLFGNDICDCAYLLELGLCGRHLRCVVMEFLRLVRSGSRCDARQLKLEACDGWGNFRSRVDKISRNSCWPGPSLHRVIETARRQDTPKANQSITLKSLRRALPSSRRKLRYNVFCFEAQAAHHPDVRRRQSRPSQRVFRQLQRWYVNIPPGVKTCFADMDKPANMQSP